MLCISVGDIRKELTPQQRALLPQLRDTTKYTTAGGMEFQKPFDAVITSLGWQYDSSVFSGNVQVCPTSSTFSLATHCRIQI